MNEIKKLRIMALALPIIDAVSTDQDGCWPGDGPSHDDHCPITDHSESLAAVEATSGLSWDFGSWKSAAAWMREEIETYIREFIESHDENDAIPEDQLFEMFCAAYMREPDADDIREGLWSHICNAVSHA